MNQLYPCRFYVSRSALENPIGIETVISSVIKKVPVCRSALENPIGIETMNI